MRNIIIKIITSDHQEQAGGQDITQKLERYDVQDQRKEEKQTIACKQLNKDKMLVLFLPQNRDQPDDNRNRQYCKDNTRKQCRTAGLVKYADTKSKGLLK